MGFIRKSILWGFMMFWTAQSARADIVVYGSPSGGAFTGTASISTVWGSSPGAGTSNQMLSLLTMTAGATIAQIDSYKANLQRLLPAESELSDQSSANKSARNYAIQRAAVQILRDAYAGKGSVSQLTASAVQQINQQFPTREIVVVARTTAPAVAPTNIQSSNVYSLANATAPATSVEEQRQRQCQQAQVDMQNLLREANSVGAKVFHLGERHQTVTDQYDAVLNQIDPTPAGSCFAVETYPNMPGMPAEYQSLMDRAAAAGWRVILMDQAAAAFNRDPQGAGVDLTGSNYISNYVTNTRDALMANTIRTVAPSCEKIVTLNGFEHIFPSTGTAQDPRVSLPQQLSDLKTTSIDMRTMEPCGRDSYNQDQNQSGQSLNQSTSSSNQSASPVSTPAPVSASVPAPQSVPITASSNNSFPAPNPAPMLSNYSIPTYMPTPVPNPSPTPAPIVVPVSTNISSSSTCPFDGAALGVNATLTCTCASPVSTSTRVWGNGIYTNDSSICAAAVHAGQISTTGGTVKIRALGPQSSFGGGLVNGVYSSTYGAWGGSYSFESQTSAPAPVAAPVFSCPRDAAALSVNVPLTCQCAGGIDSQSGIWGSGIYTSDSPICVAAVHAGKISRSGGNVTVRPLGPQTSFSPGFANGIQSWSYGYWQGSYSFD